MKGTANSFFGGRSSGQSWPRRRSWKCAPLRGLLHKSRGAAYPILGGLSNLGIVAPLVGRTIRRGGARVKLSVKPVGGKPHPDNCHIKAGLTVFFVVRLFRPTKTLPGEMR